MLILFCMRGCGRIERPAFPAPSDWGRKVHDKNSRENARRDREVMSRRHCEERLVRRSSKSEGGSDEAIQLSVARPDDRLRRTIQYSRDAGDGIDKPRRTGYPTCEPVKETGLILRS